MIVSFSYKFQIYYLFLMNPDYKIQINVYNFQQNFHFTESF